MTGYDNALSPVIFIRKNLPMIEASYKAIVNDPEAVFLDSDKPYLATKVIDGNLKLGIDHIGWNFDYEYYNKNTDTAKYLKVKEISDTNFK